MSFLGRTKVSPLAMAIMLGAAASSQAFAPPRTAASSHPRTMVAELRGGQEVPPVATNAFGSGRFIIDTNAKTVSYHISFTGIGSLESAAHIHGPASPGVNAGVKHPLPAGNPKVGVWNYDSADEADILAGRMYVNIHSANFPGGEIRGQINDFAMSMDGGQENPAVASAGKGWGTFNIDLTCRQLHYYIVIESLDNPETGAHIHGAALPGVNAGVVHDLGVGAIKTGTWNYPPSMQEALLNGRMYVNSHSTAFPAGEIRGQIVRTVVPIDGAQEVPPVPSLGAGNGYIALDLTTHTLGYYFTFANLTSAETASHIHGFAAPGVNAGVLHNLGTGSPKKGAWTYGAANEGDVRNGLTYINIHSGNFPGGEIRGQIIHANEPLCCDIQQNLSDINCDGVVDVSDLLMLLSAWGSCADCCACPGDVNCSCNVDVSDLLILLSNWG